MKYGFIEPEDLFRNLKFPLPERAKELLPHANEVRDGLRNGGDPVVLSIEKWENIYKVYEIISEFPSPYKYYSELFDGIGMETCALCLNSLQVYKKEFREVKYKSDKCKVCRLAKIDPCPQSDSSYMTIEKILGKNPIEINNFTPDKINSLHTNLGKNILKMIKNLKSMINKADLESFHLERGEK